jgi:TRAP-type C4-dicarboxylate transport system permease small subunit
MTNFLKLFSPPPIFAASNWIGVKADVATIAGAEDLYRNILQAIMGLAGLVFFAMLIVGGFKYLTSGGDPKKVASASSTITTAVIGVAGVIISWLILLFISNFTGINVTQFNISN